MKEFTQKELDAIVKERVAREKRKLERELGEQQKDIGTGESEYKSKYLDALRRTELLKAGFSLDNLGYYMPMLNKVDDPSEISKQAKTYADLAGFSPSAKAEAEHAKRKSKFKPFGFKKL
jgi:hypothetical protein